MVRIAGLLFILMTTSTFAQNVPVVDMTDGQKTIVKPEKPAAPKKLSLEEQVHDLVNQHRAKLGLVQLAFHKGIAKVAQEHSQDMADGYVKFGHGGWKERFKDTRKAFNHGKDEGHLVGENVAFGQETAKDVFRAWMDSDDHREAIEEPSFTHTGIGIAKRPGYWKRTLFGVRKWIAERTYWTQLFLWDPEVNPKPKRIKKSYEYEDEEEDEEEDDE